MNTERNRLPGIFVTDINKIFGCPFSIMIQPDKNYPPKAGEDDKFYARITTKTIELRNHCETILKALGLKVCSFVSQEIQLHCVIHASDIVRVHEELAKQPESPQTCASKLEKYLKKIFKEVKFSSTLTALTVEYIATVNKNNMTAFLQVLNNLGIEDWEAVDNDTAISFTLARIQDF